MEAQSSYIYFKGRQIPRCSNETLFLETCSESFTYHLKEIESKSARIRNVAEGYTSTFVFLISQVLNIEWWTVGTTTVGWRYPSAVGGELSVTHSGMSGKPVYSANR